jgi:erythrocyte band 7 integral membrane protein
MLRELLRKGQYFCFMVYFGCFNFCSLYTCISSIRTQTTLRHILGGKVLQDAIENREAIAGEIQDVIEPSARLWGVKIESILIKDIMFSPELQVSLSSAAQAKRVGESRVIAAKAEVDAAKLMRDAANILNTPAAMQIRYLETLSSMAKNGQGPKTIFMPLDASNKMDMRLGQPSGSQPM